MDCGRPFCAKACQASSLDWQRAIVGALLDHVDILPATEKGRKPFDAKRVNPVRRF